IALRPLNRKASLAVDIARARPRSAMPPIHVEICRPDPALEPLWKDLLGRACGNAFMAPAALAAAESLAFARIHVLLAWQHADGGKRLVAWWALQERAMVPGWPKFLLGPPFRYAFVSAPVIETGYDTSVNSALFVEV